LSSLVQRNVKFILGEAVISNIIYHHIYTAPYNILHPLGSKNLHYHPNWMKKLKAAMFKCIGNSIVHFQPYFKVMSFNKPNMHISPRNNLCMKIGSRFLYRVFQVSSEVFLIQMMFLYFNNNKMYFCLRNQKISKWIG